MTFWGPQQVFCTAWESLDLVSVGSHQDRTFCMCGWRQAPKHEFTASLAGLPPSSVPPARTRSRPQLAHSHPGYDYLVPHFSTANIKYSEGRARNPASHCAKRVPTPISPPKRSSQLFEMAQRQELRTESHDTGGWEFFLLLGVEPRFWASHPSSLSPRSPILFSLLSVCDLTYLSTLLPQRNLYFCGPGTSHEAQAMTEIKPSSLYFHSVSLCNQQLCLYQLESLPSS